MTSIMSESEEAVYNVDNDEEVIVPWPHKDCPHINKFTLEGNGVVENRWRCDWCMNPPAMFAAFSATKALAHVLQLPGSDVRPCKGIIPETFMLGYKDLYSRKMEAGRSRSGNKSSISDSIENIQERTAGAMSAASTGIRLEAVSACKFSITLSPPLLFCKTIVLI